MRDRHSSSRPAPDTWRAVTGRRGRPLTEGLRGDVEEQTIGEFVDAIAQAPDRRAELVDLLDERHPVYSGRGANAVVRIRGYVMAAFARTGLPDAALPYVLEELESGRDAYLVAAAARALRGGTTGTSEVDLLITAALTNVRQVDDAVSFNGIHPSWPAADRTTATEELLCTLDAVGLGTCAAAALRDILADPFGLSPADRTLAEALLDRPQAPSSCCSPAVVIPTDKHPSPRPVPVDVVLEDQDGRSVRFGDYVTGRPTVVVFFYTRCENPNKCSLSITRLAHLQREIRDHDLDVRTAAVTYDPDHDDPTRLTAYGRDRGVVFGPDDRFFRTVAGRAALDEYFQLGVGFGPTVVNRHRIELFVLDGAGVIVEALTRMQWRPDAVAAAVRALLPSSPAGPSPTSRSLETRCAY
jgi:protein SCO1/2